MNDAARDEQWAALYERLLAALGRFGVNDALGQGAYWLVDDDWGGHLHKLCVTSRSFWSDDVQEAIRSVLYDGFGDWGVVVVFEGNAKGSCEPFVLYQDRVSTTL